MFDPNFDERSFEEQKLWNDPRFGGKVRNQYAERMKKREAQQSAESKQPVDPLAQVNPNPNRTIQDGMLRFPPGTKPFVYPNTKPGPWSEWSFGYGENLGNLLNSGFNAQPEAPQAPKPNKFGLTRVSPGMYRDSKGNLMTSRDRRFKEIMGNPSSSAVKRQPAVVPRERGQQGE